MDNMAYYNDNYFKENYNNYHTYDTSLVCNNNIIQYLGNNKSISGSVHVNNSEIIRLGNFKISNINNNVWTLEPHILFFYIRESVKLNGLTKEELSQNAIQMYQLASKKFLDKSDEESINYFVDYFISLKQIEPYLSDNLLESYKLIRDLFSNIRSMNTQDITPGLKIVYEKLFGEIKNEASSNSQSNSRGVQRVNTNFPKTVHFSEPIDDTQRFSDAAFITMFSLLLLVLAIIVGGLTYLLS